MNAPDPGPTFQALWALRLVREDLSPTERHVLLTIVAFMGGDGSASLSNAQLVRATGLTDKTIAKSLDRLRTLGTLVCIRERSGYVHACYRIDLDAVALDTQKPPPAAKGFRVTGALSRNGSVLVSEGPRNGSETESESCRNRSETASGSSSEPGRNRVGMVPSSSRKDHGTVPTSEREGENENEKKTPPTPRGGRSDVVVVVGTPSQSPAPTEPGDTTLPFTAPSDARPVDTVAPPKQNVTVPPPRSNATGSNGGPHPTFTWHSPEEQAAGEKVSERLRTAQAKQGERNGPLSVLATLDIVRRTLTHTLPDVCGQMGRLELADILLTVDEIARSEANRLAAPGELAKTPGQLSQYLFGAIAKRKRGDARRLAAETTKTAPPRFVKPQEEPGPAASPARIHEILKNIGKPTGTI